VPTIALYQAVVGTDYYWDAAGVGLTIDASNVSGSLLCSPDPQGAAVTRYAGVANIDIVATRSSGSLDTNARVERFVRWRSLRFPLRRVGWIVTQEYNREPGFQEFVRGRRFLIVCLSQ